MKEAKIAKLILSAAGTGEKLEKEVKLLKLISGMQPIKTKSKKRIPAFGVGPGMETGCKVTIRGKKIFPLLKRLLAGINNEIKERQIEKNHFSFGIHEYMEIPGIEYQRDIGILGFNVTIDFERSGKRVERKKIKTGKVPRRYNVTREEIAEFMKKNFETKILSKEEKS